MRVLVACERSGIIRDAFIRRGLNAISCDLLPGDGEWKKNHYCGDVRDYLDEGWDMMIAHPVCRRLANSGVRWLTGNPPKGKTKREMWEEFDQAVEFYRTLRDAPIYRKAIENPVMHKYAMEALGIKKRHFVQPWYFGDPYFKATGFELFNLPPLVDTNRLVPPKKGTKEYKEWSMVHYASPGPDREKIRSESFPGMAKAMSYQWGSVK